MAKMRVHELATEIGKQSKDIVSFLEEKGIKKSATSGLEDDQISMVKSAFNPKPAAPKAEQPKAEQPKAEQPKKKKPNIIFVNNPYNSKSNERGNRGNNYSNNNNNGRGRQVGQIGQKTEMRNQNTPQPSIKAEDVKAAFEKSMGIKKPEPQQPVQAPVKPVQPVEKPVQTSTEQSIRVNAPTQAPAREQSTQRSTQTQQRPQSSQNSYQSRPQGDRPYNNNRSSNGTGNRPYEQRQQSDRPYNNNRPSNGTGNRPYEQRQQGDRPYNNNRSSNGTGNRPYEQRPQSDRPYNNNRPANGTGNRYAGNRPQGQGTAGNGGYNSDRRQGGSSNGSFSGRSDRPYQSGYNNNRGGNTGSGNNYRNNDNRSQGAARNGRPGFGSQGKPQDFAPEPSIKEQEKHRGDQDRRRQNQEKRKKDNIFNKDEEVKNKKFNPHGFIKPEKVETPPEEKIKVITLPEVLTIKDLADKMKIQPAAIVKKLFLQGTVVTVNQEITYDQAEEIAIDYDVICEQEVKVDVIAELLKEEDEDTGNMKKRPPVVCVMGHVDHGKTSLLDAIRKTNVTDREAGGITQHIGAYVVNINGEKITFLDTPGHEAFTAMRMRGANSTDIAILVVAADDGVMPQTVEAINHAKAAGIEIIIAVNKIDKPNANIDRVKQELAEYELIPEDWGGSTVFAPVSAKSGQGIKELLEMVTLTAEMLELKADPDRQARGLVIEAELDKGRGPVATVLVQKGTLRVGDFIAAGACHGKVRAMLDDKGRRMKEAGPSTPAEILGLNDVPNAGEIFVSPENDKEARHFAETFISQNKVKLLDDTKQKMSLDDLFTQIKEGNLKELNLIVKADVQGSVEAVKQSLLKLSNEEVVVKIIHGGVGAINESDVILASASNAIIIGFNVRPDATAKTTAETEGVDVRLYKVIYQAIEDVEAAMKGMLDPIYEEKVIGHAEIRQIFKASGIGNIAGAYVLDGLFERGCSVRVTREGEQIFEGPLASLKRFKDDVKEVKASFECGLVFEGFGDFAELDQVEAYKMVQVPR